ncbi:shikimate dehydrogenase family protein [Pseudomonas sp. NPDC089422]|uniref:shikimate dehydrogenase family protein n=1 Tax=Pseudomonas sp. NPDC089422 TaxID=3364466 RepID=UPI0038210819
MTTGSTRVFFMVADPIEQVRTPEIFNKVLPLCGIDAVMVPLQVAPENLVDTVRALFRSNTTAGMVLSIPHKTCAAGLVDKRSKIAATANAVNAIRRNADGTLEGALFDGLGFVKSLDRYRMPYEGKRVLIIGAGGAGSAIATSLAAGGPAQISVFDPDEAKARQVTDAIREHFAVPAVSSRSNDPAGFDLVINASPLGLKHDDPLPIPVGSLQPGTQVCDILMKNQPTPLLQASIKQGLQVQPGFDMLILQTPLFFEFFGLEHVANYLRSDDSAVREMLFPKELHRLVEPA